MIKAAIIGATGYTGLELLRLAENHPELKIEVITSREKQGKSLAEVYHWKGKYKDLIFEEPVVDKIAPKVEVAFLCVPAGKAQELAYQFLKYKVKVIDFSADFRFKSISLFEDTYKLTYLYPELNEKAVYGLCEIFTEDIKKADLIANPGCYPTSILLPLIPLVKERLIDIDFIIADSKSGVSGAGRKADLYYSFCEVNDDFKAYKIASHRHNPEIEEKLSLFAEKEIKVVFTPHLLPINRGIFSTIYLRSKHPLKVLRDCLENFYQKRPFVSICAEGIIPTIKEVRGTNLCKIGLFEDKKRGFVVIVSVIDNLIKGASGQALQNFNLMFGLPEEMGLSFSPFFV
ncbi:N-acetyl-gamma-glutamyl-phosphate reductase [Thermodesulfobacterium sp. TA1]|uniref:N-acetyl-gamma-glutamyl-phosphate reductase n=1 Tax=Thermodesulfobacterium sp. TA1 TaxID=2234087 RepID=UPI0012321948|nr:N-acetyl-gamma-glutamyl-phosphate reductase [Thermodesulfobacterium sp. TA1]QER41434.1 N-acetyl-gamma-glutamyl-phosphate reductase [Thermodesulfobacterium sp. TA1]